MKVALLIPKGKRSPAVINTIRSLAKFSEEMGIQTIGNPRKDLMLPKNGYNVFLNFINENIHFYKRLMLDARRFETLIVPYPSGIFNPLLKNPRYLKAIIDIRSVELKLWRKIGGKKRLIIYSYDLFFKPVGDLLRKKSKEPNSLRGNFLVWLILSWFLTRWQGIISWINTVLTIIGL
ncbi:MAG: hypothetical protein QW532_01100 [Archaeoglobaceae archaeon]